MEQPGRPSSRERMVLSAIALLSERGLTGTSFGGVIAHSRAPRGSIYHHFPDGKAQLVEEAVDLVGASVDAIIDGAGRDPRAALAAFAAAWQARLEGSGFRAGCPVLAVAVETHRDDPQPARTAARAFARWQARFAGLVREAGADPPHAERLATLTVAAIEGAVVLCRARGDARPLRDVTVELDALLAAALSPRRPAG